MQKRAHSVIPILFVFSLTVVIQGGENGLGGVKEVCSHYSFYGHAGNGNSWEFARMQCSGNQRALVSLETNEEWESLKNIVNDSFNSFTNDRWYIGLKYSSPKWCWLSNTKVCVNDTSSGKSLKWRWNNGEPNHINEEHCVQMLRYGSYSNIPCNKHHGYIGYICETKIDCSNASRYEYVFKFQRTTVESFTADAKHLTQKSTAQPYKPTSGSASPKTTSKRPIQGGAKTSATTAEISTTPEISTTQEISTTATAIKQTSNYITSTKPNIYSATGSGKQKTFMRSSTQDLQTCRPSITVIVVAVLAVLLVIVLVVLGYVIWRKRSSSSKALNQPQSSKNVNDSAGSVNTAVVIDEHNEKSQQTRHLREQSHYASLNQTTMMEQTGVHSYATIERIEMEEMNHGHPMDHLWIDAMQLNENELDRPAYMNVTITSHDYINI